MRVIDADEAIINFGFEWDDIPPTREEFVYFLKKQPAVNVIPVRHGRWIIDSVGGKISCSDCGCIYLRYNGRLKPNYCPNCGAKMDLRDECKQEVER